MSLSHVIDNKPNTESGSARPLRVQILSGQGPEQLVDLPLGATTIGGGPRCSLRLRGDGVRPLHCVISHGQEGPKVRRWSADTQLNGQAFTDEPLSVGDCLTLGQLDLVIVPPADDIATDQADAADNADLWAEDDQPAKAADDDTNQFATAGDTDIVPAAVAPSVRDESVARREPDDAPSDPPVAKESATKAPSVIPAHLLQPWRDASGTDAGHPLTDLDEPIEAAELMAPYEASGSVQPESTPEQVPTAEEAQPTTSEFDFKYEVDQTPGDQQTEGDQTVGDDPSPAECRRAIDRESTTARVRRLTVALRETRQQVAAGEEKQHELHNELASLQHEQTQLAESLAAAELERDNSAAKAGQLEEEIQSLRSQLVDTETQAFELRGAAVVADSRLQEGADEIGELRTTLADLERQLAERDEQLAANQEHIASLEAVVAELQELAVAAAAADEQTSPSEASPQEVADSFEAEPERSLASAEQTIAEPDAPAEVESAADDWSLAEDTPADANDSVELNLEAPSQADAPSDEWTSPEFSGENSPSEESIAKPSVDPSADWSASATEPSLDETSAPQETSIEQPTENDGASLWEATEPTDAQTPSEQTPAAELQDAQLSEPAAEASDLWSPSREHAEEAQSDHPFGNEWESETPAPASTAAEAPAFGSAAEQPDEASATDTPADPQPESSGPDGCSELWDIEAASAAISAAANASGGNPDTTDADEASVQSADAWLASFSAATAQADADIRAAKQETDQKRRDEQLDVPLAEAAPTWDAPDSDAAQPTSDQATIEEQPSPATTSEGEFELAATAESDLAEANEQFSSVPEAGAEEAMAVETAADWATESDDEWDVESGAAALDEASDAEPSEAGDELAEPSAEERAEEVAEEIAERDEPSPHDTLAGAPPFSATILREAMPTAAEPAAPELGDSELGDSELGDSELADSEAGSIEVGGLTEDEPATEPPVKQEPRITAADLIPNEQPESGSPASFIEKYADMLPPDETADAPEPVLGGGLPMHEPTSPPQPAAAGSEDGEDDSIDDYMASLMQRIRGESAAEAAPSASARVDNAKPAAPVESPASAPVRDETPLQNLDSLRSGPAPERSRDMSALRDLANQSARNAIGVAATRQNKEKALANVVISGLAMACGGYLAVSATSLASVQFVGGLVGFGWAGYWGAKTLRHMLAASSAGKEEQPKQNKPEGLPIDGVEQG